MKYRIIIDCMVVGKTRKTMGNIIPCSAKTEIGAKRILNREMKKYNVWGFIEYSVGICWKTLPNSHT